MQIRNATIYDVSIIQALIDGSIGDGTLMHVPIWKLIKNIGNFVVAEADGHMIGCLSKYKHADGVYELCSLLVKEKYRGRNIGEQLNKRLIESLNNTDFIFVITKIPAYAKQIGFIEVKKREIPGIVWIHKIRTLFEQKLTNWSVILRSRWTFMKYNRETDTT